MVVLDTSVVIDHLRQSDQQETLLRRAEKTAKEDLAISVISIQELYRGKSTKDLVQEKNLLATIGPLKILPYTYEIAELAGKLARDRQEPVEFADAAIAATALANNARIFSLNKKDFLPIQNLEFYEI